METWTEDDASASGMNLNGGNLIAALKSSDRREAQLIEHVKSVLEDKLLKEFGASGIAEEIISRVADDISNRICLSISTALNNMELAAHSVLQQAMSSSKWEGLANQLLGHVLEIRSANKKKSAKQKTPYAALGRKLDENNPRLKKVKKPAKRTKRGQRTMRRQVA